MRVRDGLQLVYCTNIHPACGWPAVLDALSRHAPPLRERLLGERASEARERDAPAEKRDAEAGGRVPKSGPQGPHARGGELGLGLRLSDEESRALESPEVLREFADFLREKRLYVPVMNGFPFGAFHGTPVKARVFAPDWREAARLEYTLRLARILAALLPEGEEGGVSTVPLSHRAWIQDPAAWLAITHRFAEAAVALSRLQDDTGRSVGIDVEPEPDGLVECTDELVRWYEEWLLRSGVEHAMRLGGLTASRAEEVVRRHVRACVDTCHAAVLFEDPRDVLRRLSAAGIRVGRIQVTAALRVSGGTTREMLSRLAAWSEPVYLHQVAGRAPDGTIHRWPDLPVSAPGVELEEVRTHFHVPLFHASDGTTAEETLAVLKSPHARGILELETYTWDVLPEDRRSGLVDSIEREFRWALEAIA